MRAPFRDRAAAAMFVAGQVLLLLGLIGAVLALSVFLFTKTLTGP